MRLDPDDLPQVATAFQNEDHRVEVQLLNAAIDALSGSKESALAAIDALGVHTKEHFDREDEAMKRTGFPPFPVHHGEHVRVLTEFTGKADHFRRTGDVAAMRQYLEVEVVDWFLAHLRSMDAVTAQWIASR